MSNPKKAVRLRDATGTMDIIAGDSTWSRTRTRQFTLQTSDGNIATLATIPLDDNTCTKLDVIIHREQQVRPTEPNSTYLLDTPATPPAPLQS